MMTISAHVVIRPHGSLEQTATRLGTALGVTFVPETTGRYEEYPAYCADVLGLHLALLGVPEPEHDIRSERTSDFELQVISETSSPTPTVNISAFVAEVITLNSDLKCWPLG